MFPKVLALKMIEFENFIEIAKRMREVASRKGPSALFYIREDSRQDSYLMSLILVAERDQRLFQISVSDDAPYADGFFKKTGADYELKLLHVIYPFDRVDYVQGAEIFEHWILNLCDEKWLEEHMNSIFEA